ncbi:MAG: DUF2058 domain-containing protein [Planctomycetes bacterium]|nr:DUF2058 domain-containing protein [Planctomycetota bacterium]
MGDLRDALKKAGLIDDKTDRRLKHEQRVEKKELGRDGLEERQRREAAERAAREEQKRAEVKAAQARLDHERGRGERARKLAAALTEQALRGTSGPRRFHWVDAEGYCPWIALDDETGRRLEAGELALVALPDRAETALVPRALALELHAFSPDRILHLAGGRS